MVKVLLSPYDQESMPKLFLPSLFSFIVFAAFTARAETIEFPEEELSTESVLPVFDKKVVVRQRAVKTAGRFEIGVGGGADGYWLASPSNPVARCQPHRTDAGRIGSDPCT